MFGGVRELQAVYVFPMTKGIRSLSLGVGSWRNSLRDTSVLYCYRTKSARDLTPLRVLTIWNESGLNRWSDSSIFCWV